MRLYADQPGTRGRQVVTDLLVLAWIALWIVIARWVHDLVSTLAAPGRTMASAGASLHEGLASAGEQISEVPLVGDELRAPFDAAGDAADTLRGAGESLQEGVARAALLTSVAVALWPILVVLVWWLWSRVRFARRAAAADHLLADGAGIELFALRALAHRPLRQLARVSPDPAGALRSQDPVVLRALAGLELRSLGVRLPAGRDGGGATVLRSAG